MPSATDPERQLASFLAKYSPEIANLAEALRGRMRRLFPTALELVYDNYNALAIGYSPSERASEGIFSIALYPRWVSFFFLQARGLRDPEFLLRGSGTVCKHVVMPSLVEWDDPAFVDLRRQAVELAKVPFPAKGEHCLVIKSVSANQRPRRPKGRSVTSAKRANSANNAKRAVSAKPR